MSLRDRSALASLTSIGSGNIAVVGGAGGPYTIRFMGSMAGENQLQLTPNGSGLTGGTSPSVGVITSIPGGDSGLAASTTDPRGIVTKDDLDMLGRDIDTVNAFSTGVPSASDDQTTTYTYNGDDEVLTQTALVPVPPTGEPVNQTTGYVYGFNSNDTIHSNDLLATVEYPDPTTGHWVKNDVLGREVRDWIFPVGDVDATVRSLDFSYNNQGLLWLASVENATNVVQNQVEDVYNGKRGGALELFSGGLLRLKWTCFQTKIGETLIQSMSGCGVNRRWLTCRRRLMPGWSLTMKPSGGR